MISGALLSHYVSLFCGLGVVAFIRRMLSVKNPHLPNAESFGFFVLI